MTIGHEAILALEARRREAMLAGDASSLNDLLHEDLVYTHSTAGVDGKTSFLEKCTNGSLRYQSIEVSECFVTSIPQGALVHYDMKMEVEVSGTARVVRSRAMSVWTETQAVFRLIAFHATPKP